MITAEQKAESFMRIFKVDFNIELTGQAYEGIKMSFIMALKDQDRDTRHACAEAVMECDGVGEEGIITRDNAHNACINVKAV